jgi:hypothetical protein
VCGFFRLAKTSQRNVFRDIFQSLSTAIGFDGVGIIEKVRADGSATESSLFGKDLCTVLTMLGPSEW